MNKCPKCGQPLLYGAKECSFCERFSKPINAMVQSDYNNQKAKIIITRKNRLVGSAQSHDIYVDGINVGVLKNGGKIEIPVEMGVHSISLKSKIKLIGKDVSHTVIANEINSTIKLLVDFKPNGNFEITSENNNSLLSSNVNQLSPEDTLNILAIPNPSISLEENENCYYIGDASAIHQKNVVTGHINRGTGGSVRIAKGLSVRVGGGTSQTIRENVNEYYEGKLYITNYRIILLAPKYGFNLPVSKITQLIYMNDGLQIYSGAKSHTVSTNDVLKIREIIEFLNGQNAFKERRKQSTQRPIVSEANELIKFKKLLDDGVITQEEFDAKKKQILGL